MNKSGQETSGDLEISEIEDYDTDSGVGGYLMGRDATDDYCDLKADVDDGVYKEFAKTNLLRQSKGQREQPFGRFQSKLNKPGGKSRFGKTRARFR